MSEMYIYLKVEILKKLEGKKEEFFNFVGMLGNIYGKWENLTNMKEFAGRSVVNSKEIYSIFIPEKYGMVFALKRLVRKYGEDGFIFSAAPVEKEGFIERGLLLDKMYEFAYSDIVPYVTEDY